MTPEPLDYRVGVTVTIWDRRRGFSVETDGRAWKVGDETVVLLVDSQSGKTRRGVAPFMVVSTERRFGSLADAVKAIRSGGR